MSSTSSELTVEQFIANSYDYIVVGAGTAGLAVAARLSEDPTVSVGVIEAGKDSNHLPTVKIPGLRLRNLNNPDLDWCFQGVPQESLDGRIVPANKGKGVGGTSNASNSLNFMIFSRPAGVEFDGISDLGNPGWNWKELLPFFNKSESLSVDENHANLCHLKPDPEYHGQNGPIQVTVPRWISDLHVPFMETCASLEPPISINVDPANGANVGVATQYLAIHPVTVTRESSATSYFRAARDRPNFAILTEALVSKIDLESADDGLVKATSVRFIHSGKEHHVRVTREVVLSAGAHQSPQVLELSGIGDPQILAKHGISPLVNLPAVGTNLRKFYRSNLVRTSLIRLDHFSTEVVFQVDSKYETLETLKDPATLAKAMEEYKLTQTGFLSSMTSCFAFVSLPMMLEGSEIEVVNERIRKDVSDGIAGGQKVKALYKDWMASRSVSQIEIAMIPTFFAPWDFTIQGEPGARHMTFLLVLQHPLSRGTAHIDSSDATHSPRIDHGYLNNPVDIELLVQSIRFARKMVKSDPIRSAIIKEVMPGPEVDGQDELVQFVKKSLYPLFHPAGTCSMLPKQDGGVVNPRLLVYGTSNIRVVDASVFPVLPSSHPQATIYAFAEKAADLIKEDARKAYH